VSYLLDTDCVVEYLRGRAEAVQLVTSLRLAGVAISIVTFGEIYEGIHYGERRETHERGFRDFLRLVPVLPLRQRDMKRFAIIRGALRRSGSPIGDPDLLIAATAIERDLMLVTGNLRHFGRISGLKTLDFRERPPRS
jgi:tRNA(fMet)-specific endonuclease VapC